MNNQLDSSLIAGIPGIIALIVCMRRGPERAFVDVYLPTLMLLPDSYHWMITGHLSFNQTAIIPIAVFVLFRSWRDWHWSFCDLLVITYVALQAVSQYINVSYWDAQNVALVAICNVIFPYVVAKQTLAGEEFFAEISKRIVVCLTAVAIISVYEFRMGRNPFDMILMPFFPGQSSAIWQGRYGFLRPAGPYGHAITAATIFAVGYRLSRWPDWVPHGQDGMHFLGIGAKRFCRAWLVLGAFMTLSRGPWLGAALGAIVVWLGRARNRKRAMVIFTVLILLVGIPLFEAAKSYVWIERAQAGASGSMQETAAYRHELLEKYIAVVEERPDWGWGRSAFPAIDGLRSVDNNFLLLALSYGEYALGVFVLMLLWLMGRQAGVCRAHDSTTFQGAVALTSLACVVIITVSITTTALLWTSVQILFLTAGWGEAIASRQPLRVLEKVQRSSLGLRFSRVMV